MSLSKYAANQVPEVRIDVLNLVCELSILIPHGLV